MQRDLFGTPAVLPVSSSSAKKDFLDRYRFILRLDQAVIAVIVLLVVYVLIFSFGVETGKRYAMAEIRAERAKREHMAEELREKIFENATRAGAGNGSADPAFSPRLESARPAPPATELPKSEPGPPQNAQTPVTPPEAVNVSSRPAGKYTIQTITFTSKSQAEKEIKRLAFKGYHGFILPSGRFQQVCVEGFDSRQRAAEILQQLKKEGLASRDAYIRPFSP